MEMIMMEKHLQDLLAEIQEFGRTFDKSEQVPDKRMRNLNPETAQLVSLLARSGRRTRLLEIGTSSGYSTIWLAWSVQQHGGQVTSIDHSEEKLALAQANLQRAGLSEIVELRHGDATDIVSELDGPFDFVLFDSVQVKPYLQLERLLPKLTKDALVLADNVLSHVADMQPFLDLIDAQPDFDRVVVPVGKGLCVASKYEL
ncbi:class I SAM-dependent methyltransferase [soil metagenome]